MDKIKKNGFTLTEVLIVLSLIGALATLILPGLIKETQSKTSMTLLQSTVAELGDAVQKELVSQGTNKVSETEIKTNTQAFLKKHFDVLKTCTGQASPCYGDTYYQYSGDTEVDIYANAPVLLKNGVTIDIIPPGDVPRTNTPYTEGEYLVNIDLNGADAPNRDGIDRFLLCLASSTPTNQTYSIRHAGEVGSCAQFSKWGLSDAISRCKWGYNTNQGSFYCYAALEQSGFDPEKLK